MYVDKLFTDTHLAVPGPAAFNVMSSMAGAMPIFRSGKQPILRSQSSRPRDGRQHQKWSKQEITTKTEAEAIFDDLKKSDPRAPRRIPPHQPALHDLRHEYASRLVERNVPLAQVRDLLGHASIITTERYDNQKLENLQAAAARLERGETFDPGPREASSPSICQVFVKSEGDQAVMTRRIVFAKRPLTPTTIRI